METLTDKKTAMYTLINMYEWHTKLFKNVLVDISDKHASERLGTKANHIAWIAGSLANERFGLGKLLGLELTSNSEDLFKDHQGIKDDATYPSLEELKRDWDKISPFLKNALLNVSMEQLNGPDPFNMPGGTFTFFDTIVACTDRESYCIGQIGLWRRLLGYDPMKYM